METPNPPLSEADFQAFDGRAREISQKVLNGESTMQIELGLTEEQMESVYTIGFNLYRNRRNEDARRIFSFLAMLNPLEYKYHFGLAATCHVQNHFDMAALHYLQSAMIDDTRPEPWYHLSECLLALDDPVGAAENLPKAIQRCGSDENGHRIRNRAAAMLENLQTGAGREQEDP
jgi:type III secretion system low calcium response chaperone LcrH/SycD